MRRYPNFPVDALPDAVAAWVHGTAEHTQTPADLAALAALGVLSAAAIGGVLVDCGPWEEELALYLLAAMPSGDRKSTVLRTAVQPLRDIERDRREIAAPRVRERRSRREVLELRTRKLTKIVAEHSDPAERLGAARELANVGAELESIGEPAMPRMLANDATPEALGGLLTAQHTADHAGDAHSYANSAKNRADIVPARRTELAGGGLSPPRPTTRPIDPRKFSAETP